MHGGPTGHAAGPPPPIIPTAEEDEAIYDQTGKCAYIV